MSSADSITYPYIPAGRTIKYVSASDRFMQAARKMAKNALDYTVPTASIIAKDGQIVARGANGSRYHDEHPCQRKLLGIPTGQGYELCEGCHPKNHSEAKAIAQARQLRIDINGADLYLWGHWWCCQHCWDAMEAAGIRQVHLLEGSQFLFNKTSSNNILPR